MALHARDWSELRELLVVRIGDEATDKLMDFLPPTGFAGLATTHEVLALRGDMHAEFTAFRGEMLAEFAAVRTEIAGVRTEIERATKSLIKWTASLVFPTLVAGIGASAAITAAIVA